MNDAPASPPPAVLLDRDGVINFDSPDYILSPDDWRPIPGSLEAIARLSRAGVRVAVVSNQSAIGRGMIDAATFDAVQEKMVRAVEAAGGRIDHFAYCPHAPEEGCDCRKPKPGLVEGALEALELNERRGEVVFIGDSRRDVAAAVAAGVRPILVRSGYGDADEIYAQSSALVPGIESHADLRAAVEALLRD